MLSTVRDPRCGEAIVREITSPGPTLRVIVWNAVAPAAGVLGPLALDQLQLLSDRDDEVDLVPVMVAKEVDVGGAAPGGSTSAGSGRARASRTSEPSRSLRSRSRAERSPTRKQASPVSVK